MSEPEIGGRQPLMIRVRRLAFEAVMRGVKSRRG